MLLNLIRPRPLTGGSLIALFTLLAACSGSGEGPAGPNDDDENEPAAQAFSIASPNVQALQIVTVGVRGVTVSSATVDAKLDTTSIKLARLDDTTFVVVVPQNTTGTHQLSVTIGNKTFTSTLNVSAAPTVADPNAYLAQLIGTLSAKADSIDARLAATAPGTSPADTAGLGSISQKLHWAADSAQKIVNAMSAADRAAAAAYLQVNSPFPQAPTTSLVSFARAGCNGGTTAECNAELRAQWEELQGKIASCTTSAAGFAVVGGVLGGVLGSGVFSVPGAAIGAVIGAAGGAAICVYDINKTAMEKITEPAITHLEQAVASESRVAFAAAPAAVEYLVKTPRKVQVTARVRSLIAADVSESGEIGLLARAVARCTSLWSVLMQKTGFSVTGPKLPTSPAFTELRDMPASELEIGTISLPGATATTAGGDTAFYVTFQNDKQGTDHQFSYAVRYAPSGRTPEELPLSGVLKPATYVVAQVAIDSVPSEMRVGQGTKQLRFTARDSSGTFLGNSTVDSLLNGRRPQWTSTKTNVASVSSAGVVTALDSGTATITAQLEQGTKAATFTVYPSVVGVWHLKELNGRTVPFDLPDSTGNSHIGGGSITINADSTFSFGYSEKYTNKFTNIEYDEGASGSGTYVLNGNSITFTLLDKSGDKVNELVGGGFSSQGLSVTYTGSEGSALGILRKN